MPADARYYGMGEKWLDRIELSGLRTKYWNTDVWSDFHWAQWGSHPVDPPYFTTPYLIVRSERGYVGFLIHNPGVTYMETPGHDRTRVFVAWQETYPNLLHVSEPIAGGRMRSAEPVGAGGYRPQCPHGKVAEARRRDAAPAHVGAGLPPKPVGLRRRTRPGEAQSQVCQRRDPVQRAVAGPGLHGGLSHLHGGRQAVPERGGPGRRQAPGERPAHCADPGPRREEGSRIQHL